MLSITFQRDITPLGDYINDCGYGGDVIINWLNDVVLPGTESVESGQEDWGWYKWYQQKNQRIEVNVCCQNLETGEYEVQLYHMKKNGLLTWKEAPDDISSIGKVLCEIFRNNECNNIITTDENGRK